MPSRGAPGWGMVVQHARIGKSSSLVVFVNIQEPNSRLTYASVAVKTLVVWVCSEHPRMLQCPAMYNVAPPL